MDLRTLSGGSCRHCQGCRDTGQCVVQDDVQQVYQRIRAANHLVLASPIHFSGVTGEMKCFIDRGQQFWVESYRLKRRPTEVPEPRRGIFLATCGGTDTRVFGWAEHSVKAFFSSAAFRYWGTLFEANTDAPPPVAERAEVLARAEALGRALSAGGKERSMKVLGLQASPNEHGLTASMAEKALAGARKAGAKTELVHLCQLDLATCRACDTGWGLCRQEGRCIIEDDLAAVRAKMTEAEAIVLATPVYFGDVAEVLKACFDRLRRCQFGGPEETRMIGAFVLGIAAAGGSGGGGPTCLVSMDRYYAHMGLRTFDQMIATRRSRDYMLETAERAGAAMVRYVEEQRAGGGRA